MSDVKTDLLRLLESSGFNHHESSVYLELLKRGEQSAARLGKVAGAPRSTVRSILDKLCAKGVVGKVYKRNTQHYFCLPIDSLTHSIEQDIDRHREKLARLRESLPLFAQVRGEKSLLPKVQYFEGEKATIEAFNHALFQDIHEILYITSYAFSQSPAAWKNDLELFIPTRVKKGIRLRALCHPNDEALMFLKTSKAQLREHRFLSRDVPLPGNIAIYGDFTAHYCTTDGEYMAVIIESAVIAQTMRGVFEHMWLSAEKT